MQSLLPPLRAMHAFESFGRLGSVSAAAIELNVTPGAISQQIKILEEYLNMPLIMKDGRKATLTPTAKTYHEAISLGFDRLKQAQRLLLQQKTDVDVQISGLPTLLLKWLNPRLHHFNAQYGQTGIRLEATHAEPDGQFLDHMFRLTYGTAAGAYIHSRVLFTDICFPVCSPDFLRRNPVAMDKDKLGTLPWIDIDWGPSYTDVPHLQDWLDSQSATTALQKPASIHSLSSSALEAAAHGQGVVLAQRAFVQLDLDSGNLIRLSEQTIDMPESYFICWGTSTLEQDGSRNFLNWVLAEARQQQFSKTK